MKSLMILIGVFCSLAGLGFAQEPTADLPPCYNFREVINDTCAICKCDPVSQGSAIGRWSCQTFCPECPSYIVDEVCIYSQCEFGVECPRFPEAECKIPDCGTCEAKFFLNEQEVECQLDCPEGIAQARCSSDPCDADCPPYPLAECRPNYCGGCFAEFYDATGNRVNCSENFSCSTHNPCLNGALCFDGAEEVAGYFCLCTVGFDGKNCEIPMPRPGYCPMRDRGAMYVCHNCREDNECPGVKKCCGGCCAEPRESMHPNSCPLAHPYMNCSYEEVCSQSSCSRFPHARCIVDHCGGCSPVFVGFQGMRFNCTSGEDSSGCPAGLPFTNCFYDDVCSPQTTCDFYPNARCLVDHCGGCRPVFVGFGGAHLNCATGEVMDCPADKPRVACFVNPCDMAECPADPMARCVPVYCGMCHALFVNTEGLHVDCQTGEAISCPRGLVEETMMAMNPCEGAVCPSNPRAKCVSSPCMNPNKPLDCPVEFYDVSARLVKCRREKPGMCPMVPFGALGICFEECEDDTNCDDHEKCCSNGCGHVCRDPFKQMNVKPGMCPMLPPGTVGICVEECRNDSECMGNKKCCSNGCGHTCREPAMPMKPGMCPMLPPGTGGICVEGCRNDSECMGNKKCCSNGCGHTCRDPMPLKPGMCPMLPPGTGGICVEECRNDSECMGNKKCCSNGCGHTCREPAMPMKPGMCPMLPPGTVGICVEECRNDSECMGNKKCCSNGCGHTCREPAIPMKPGMCPMLPPGTGGICVEECRNDSECMGNKKCCSNGCGHTCSKPAMPMKPGMCPMIMDDTVGICVEGCRNDSECMGNKKCCSNGCGHTCREPRMPNKPGVCPMVPPGTERICVEECMNDSHCEGRKKCCSNGCGHTCREPQMRTDVMMMKPGTCPMDYAAFCGECTSDAQCRGRQKCCNQGCCMNPIEMPGECPHVPMMPGLSRSPDSCEEQCSSDSDCEGHGMGKKCCSNGCGTKCMQPIRDMKPGTCLRIPMNVGGICVEECSGDEECSDRLKCCSNGCGHSCMFPQEFPGDCPSSMPWGMTPSAIRQSMCTEDEDCFGKGHHSKCCSFGCRSVCVEPVREEKAGMCPKIEQDSGGICVQMCDGDQDCEGNKKCCSNGCGYVCIEPEDRPGACPYIRGDVGGICVESCRGDFQCQRGQKCCSNGCGHQCMLTVPVIKDDGECPEMEPGDGPMQETCESNCVSDNECPGRSKCCSVSCGKMCLHPKPSPPECTEDQPEERCDPNPCDHATCPSHPDAQCAPNMCGQCRPEFFDKQGMKVYCSGHTYCNGLSDGESHMAGTVHDSSDGCNQCVCTGKGTWQCTAIKCGVVIQVSVVLNGSFENVSHRKEMFINKLKLVLSSRFNLPTWAFRDFKISRGSIVVDFKVSDSDSLGPEQVRESVDQMREEVLSGKFEIEFEGERLQAQRDSFKDSKVLPTTSSKPRTKLNDQVMLIAIGVTLGVVFLVVLIAIISCVVKGKKEKKEKQKSENLEFNEYSGSVVAQEWKQ